MVFTRDYGGKMSNLLPTDYQSFIHQSRYASTLMVEAVSHGLRQ